MHRQTDRWTDRNKLITITLSYRRALITVFRQVPEDGVDKIIKTSPTKSFLLDPWPTFLIKECFDILLSLLTELVSCSLMEGCLPDALKTAVVTPLIKKGNLPSDNLKNYRPVSGLCFISKLVKRVAAKQQLVQIHVHNISNPYQSAYKTGHSTETALLSIKMKFTYLCQAVNPLP